MSLSTRIPLKRATLGMAILGLISAALVFFTRPALVVLAYGLVLLYLAWGVYHLVITVAGIKPPFRPEGSPGVLPKISAIVPAMDEPILARTVEVLVEHVDYPKSKKEIVVVTDDPLGERIAALLQHRYQGVVKAIARREFFPAKPSALNDGLAFCSGEVVSIVDAEDIPDSDTYLKAVTALVNHGYDAVQVILRIINEDDSWITKVFALEYAGWFRVWLNGRSRLGLYTPLGGTGNYFWRRAATTVGGWDSLNVAEDAELAVRMTLSKMRIGVIDARHWEEAPVRFRAWLRQRTRWYRGWLQSLWKSLPWVFRPSLLRRVGVLTLASILLMLISPLVVLMNWVSFALTGLYVLELYGLAPPLLSNVFPWWALMPLATNVLYFGAWILGGKYEKVGVRWWKMLPYMLLYFYILLPLASLRALYQEIFKPVIWEKTAHSGVGVRGFVKETGAAPAKPVETHGPPMREEPSGYVMWTEEEPISPGVALILWTIVLMVNLVALSTLLASPYALYPLLRF